ncbi:hypothetical protein K443DRAFT_683674 [Laccaria amethystina LaAM-08-1]|uniref:Unplaced genomic scaffold K443scaffold_254, whole genome shotgun sequence n=1 Tax=Laccaria amethystina LaAM-08-1 TaxID=1095629 RepID=A0A0C9XA38_9AGAR|nr:hypothetical protein K443DRAFT_683674 [Laccaria amethystina LaAM-08-1]
MDEDKVEAFFGRYKMVGCGNCEACIGARARQREGDGGQDARLTEVSNAAEIPS